MRKVDIVYMGKVSAKNGVSSIIRSYLDNISLFKNSGIDLNIYGLEDSISDDNIVERTNKKRSLRSIFLRYTKNNYILSVVFVLRAYFYNAYKSVNKYLIEDKIGDVIFFQDLFSCYFYLKLRKKSNVKIVLVLHNNGEAFKMVYDYFPALKNSLFSTWLEKLSDLCFEKVDKIGFVSNFSMNNFNLLSKQKYKKKLFFVHNGVVDDKNDFFQEKKVNSTNLTLVCAASVSYRKGQDIIIHSLSNMDVEKGRLNILFLGDGPELNKLRKEVDKLELNSFIQFEGSVDNVDDYLKNADGFILMSRDEGLPMCIIEAMRAHLPIISTNIAGIPEQVSDRKNGYIIEPNSIALKNVLEEILLDDVSVEKFRMMGKNSRRKFEQEFTLSKMIERYSEILNAV
ncbi:glycosyltransferase family 4 protein [Aureibacter tunicatorum]|uniref:Glycosyltransferase involved in cell wall biosynthesis n=1 Tax=Aureibacter tunicatorum TaxID=866807 RepID=A0AAE3XML5_9BACT|nr:glycosyltransferase family 4 protein [Aureibacter tunicatorum]MDR6240696.1 glycosyltransferase involved in cell wall biosynthesis [Aureibacter tunicatorum]BDD06971.1 glycosyl transferase [Aureibacter tunicatorum]